MYLDEPKPNEIKNHKVIIDCRKKVNITSVQDVDSFNESEIILMTTAGAITICGEDLHITKLNLEEGILVIEGMIQSLDYKDHELERHSGKGFLSKVFS
jgi:sporulation protein YabP